MTGARNGGGWLWRHGPSIAGEVVVNLVAPVVVYDRLAPAHGDVVALFAASVPPALWSLAAFARTRRVDAIAAMVLAGIALSLLALVGGGSARLLQVRENLVTGVVALLFLVSAAIGRPLIAVFAEAGAARHSPAMAATFAARRDLPAYQRTVMRMTLVWGLGLLASTAIACALVYALTIHDYLIAGPIVGYGVMALLTLWTLHDGRRAYRMTGGDLTTDSAVDRS